ncbi:MAG: long-chain fatty acid--CoA ligase [Aeromicrobium sp.]
MLDHLGRDLDSAAIIALGDDGLRTWSRRDFGRMTAGAVELLTSVGGQPGAVVPALLSTRPASVALLLAGALADHPLAPLAPRMTFHELHACLTGIPGEVLLCEPAWVDLAGQLGEATGKRVVVIDEPPVSDHALPPRRNPSATAFVMHTSGTTGLPKQVVVRERPLGRRGDVNGLLLDLHPNDRLVTAALFHHVGALGNIAVALANGAALVMMPTFSVEAWRALEPVAPTHAVLVPSVIEMLLDAKALSLPSLTVIGYGGSPIHPDTMRTIQEVIPGAAFVNLFGQTEGSPVSVLDAADHRRAAAGEVELLSSVGRAAPETEIRIHEPDADGIGEVWARGGHSFVVDENGWQHTGDLGRLEGEYLYLVGRRGDKIIRGGENVFPLEVEQVLESHASVREAVVVGVPDRRLGETITAYVVPASGATIDPEELRAYAREQLAGFKVPTTWEVIEAMPRNPSGKVIRRELAERAAEEAAARTS